MIGTFGDITFNVSSFRVLTFRDMKQEFTSRYANHEVIGTKPKKEYLGPGLKNVSLSIDVYRYLGADPESIAKYFEVLAENGKVSRFILGNENKGRYTVSSVSETYNIIRNNGMTDSLSLDLTLEEYW